MTSVVTNKHANNFALGTVLYVFVIGMIVLLARAAWVRNFDPDEFQHLETAWLIAKSEIPYRDFFEHHVPLYHFAISQLLSSSDLITNGDAAVWAVIELRLISVSLCVCILVLTYFVTRKLAGRLQALFAVVLLVSSTVFIRKAVEIRPDQLATLLLLISTLTLIYAKDSDRWRWHVVLSGATTALAILTTQKILLAVPGLAVTFFVGFAQRRMLARDLAQGCVIFAGAAAIAAIPLLLYFWSHEALDDFIRDNFLLVANWKYSATLARHFVTIFKEDGLFVFLIGLGLAVCLNQKRELICWWLAVLAPFFSTVLFMPVFPAVQLQYIFLILPYAAVLGGVGAAFAIRTFVAPRRKIVQLAMMMPPLAIALHGISLMGVISDNKETLAALRYIVERTTPDATVMPAWTPGIAFRKPAFFYFSLHPEIRFIIPEKAYAKLLEGLRSGDVAPEVIEMDDNMKKMPPEIVGILKMDWKPTGIGNLWRRKQDDDKS